jgi:hypothetical protein
VARLEIFSFTCIHCVFRRFRHGVKLVCHWQTIRYRCNCRQYSRGYEVKPNGVPVRPFPAEGHRRSVTFEEYNLDRSRTNGANEADCPTGGNFRKSDPGSSRHEHMATRS